MCACAVPRVVFARASDACPTTDRCWAVLHWLTLRLVEDERVAFGVLAERHEARFVHFDVIADLRAPRAEMVCRGFDVGNAEHDPVTRIPVPVIQAPQAERGAVRQFELRTLFRGPRAGEAHDIAP